MTPSHPYEFKMIRAKEIQINSIYQRGVQTPIIRRIMREFDYHLVNPVKVIFRSGIYYAFDGQQTTTGLRMKFGDSYLVPCMVYYDVPTWVDEAILFEGTNDKKAKKAVSDLDRWKSRMARGEESAVDITRIVERHGLKVALSKGDKGRKFVRAIASLDSIYHDYGKEILEETIDIIVKGFDYETASLQATILRGMAIFVSKYAGDYDKKYLIGRLKKNNATNIIRAGKSSVASGNSKYAVEIWNIYNVYAKQKLPNKF